ncbi:MAG: hypothetical protein CTY39_11290, partial [Hyphomicrobium sp.]
MRSLSQSELSAQSGVAQGTLSKIEQGLKDATDDVIEKLAQVLQCPVSFFFQAEREY